MEIHISISTGAAFGSPEQTVQLLERVGFRYAELGSSHGEALLQRGASGWQQFRIFAEAHHVLFRQGHLPLHDDITLKDDQERQKQIQRHIDFCQMYHALGIPVAVLHCFGYSHPGESEKEVRARRIASLQKILAALPEGMTICLENLPYETFEDVEANLTAAGNPPNLGFCLDTGHLHISRTPDAFADYIRRAGKRLKALHLHDNPGRLFTGEPKGTNWHSSDKHMFPGFFNGSIDWYEVISALREINYSGLWNVELSADLNERVLFPEFRELVLRQNRERADLLFNLDPAAPQKGDPQSDFHQFQQLSNHGVSTRFAGWSIAVSTAKYSLLVDPVHGGRICSWFSFGCDMLPKNWNYGWEVCGVWQPQAAMFLMHRGTELEALQAVPAGIQMVMSRTIADDCDALAGLKVIITRTFRADGFSTAVKLTNTREKDTLEFALRFHNMPLLMGGNGLPPGIIRFANGGELARDGKPWLCRVGTVDPRIEAPIPQARIKDIVTPELTLDAPGTGALTLTFPAAKPCAIYFCDTESGSGTLEPIFPMQKLSAGESCEASCSVNL